MNSLSSSAYKKVYVIAGPTAVGKTAVAIQLAAYLGTEIISADSRQCYRELNIGVARPASAELALIKHHFIASHSISDEVNAGVFETYGLDKLAQIFSVKDNAVVVGGTGLYIKSLCEGIDELPKVDAGIRAVITRGYAMNGIAWLQEQVEKKDPMFFAEGEIQNPQRMMRALEVVMSTGKSIRSFQKGQKAIRPFSIKKIGLDIPREDLYSRINLRVDHMMDAGLLDEAESLFIEYGLANRPAYQLPPALNTVGYAELFAHFKGELSLPAAIEQIKQHTRNYAKRQLTWFRKDPAIEWMTPDEFTRRLIPGG
ncbi:tRNA (adenosine(37)-N6)-dimethylallyltransferase MiaA [Flavihumibacter fluvii]|uniref:tRNA (adenosine(37)-N6)-dimethylallyltransferase MiaA n=1 Tax=Flavihumibacter fluvii TaxID=2838157 RepID=UPI001BDEB302|nr:tRNA (adenosine(37)-N6)-dimethylallyltransferase MiaA [Flavihumibacter fluvii]ULQ53569.1 tRNA (adenosine(37)-N6)-dimethylallyltransferase MiaA [Flavihumibacter fluvii]